MVVLILGYALSRKAGSTVVAVKARNSFVCFSGRKGALRRGLLY